MQHGGVWQQSNSQLVYLQYPTKKQRSQADHKNKSMEHNYGSKKI
jgi:hypothetical protein